MDEINSYSKKNLALEIIETEGYTKNIPEVIESRIINQDCLLDNSQVVILRNVYGNVYGSTR